MRLSNKFCSLQKVLVNVSLQISTALSLTLKIVMTRTLICTGIIWDDQIWILIGSNVDTTPTSRSRSTPICRATLAPSLPITISWATPTFQATSVRNWCHGVFASLLGLHSRPQGQGGVPQPKGHQQHNCRIQPWAQWQHSAVSRRADDLQQSSRI